MCLFTKYSGISLSIWSENSLNLYYVIFKSSVLSLFNLRGFNIESFLLKELSDLDLGKGALYPQWLKERCRREFCTPGRVNHAG